MKDAFASFGLLFLVFFYIPSFAVKFAKITVLAYLPLLSYLPLPYLRVGTLTYLVLRVLTN